MTHNQRKKKRRLSTAILADFPYFEKNKISLEEWCLLGCYALWLL
jgi:hypothetical protein